MATRTSKWDPKYAACPSQADGERRKVSGVISNRQHATLRRIADERGKTINELVKIALHRFIYSMRKAS